MNVNITGPRILAEFSFFGLCDVTITQTTLTSLLVLAAVTILCWRLGRNLRKRPGRMQAVTERAVLAVYKLVDDTMGKHNERFAPYIGALFCSSVLGSLASLTGFLRSSTADLSTTLTWALMTTALVWYNNIKNNNGAEMIVVIMGEIMRMPGLPKDPQAKRIDIVDGVIEGLS